MLPFCTYIFKITYHKSMLTVPIKIKNLLPHITLTVPTKKSTIFTWVTFYIAVHLLANLIRINTHFIPLFIMTKMSRNVDISFLQKNKKSTLCCCHSRFQSLIFSIIFPYFTILLYLYNEFFNPEFWPTFTPFR